MTDKSASREIVHASDCAIHNGPALPPGPCNCGAADAALLAAIKAGSKKP